MLGNEEIGRYYDVSESERRASMPCLSCRYDLRNVFWNIPLDELRACDMQAGKQAHQRRSKWLESYGLQHPSARLIRLGRLGLQKRRLLTLYCLPKAAKKFAEKQDTEPQVDNGLEQNKAEREANVLAPDQAQSEHEPHIGRHDE